MNRFLALGIIFLTCGVCRGGFTPGRYELETLGGQKMGEIVVAISTAEYGGSPAQKMEIKTIIDGGEKGIGEEEVAFFNSKGLVYFKRVTREAAGETFLEGERDPQKISIRKKVGEDKSVYGVPLSSFDLSIYEMDLAKSPFFKMSLGERKETRLFSVDDLSAVKSVRFVKNIKEMNFGGKNIKVFVVNTSVGKKIYHSWFDVKTHRLMFERGPDQVLKRIE